MESTRLTLDEIIDIMVACQTKIDFSTDWVNRLPEDDYWKKEVERWTSLYNKFRKVHEVVLMKLH